MVDPVHCAAADPDDPSVLDGERPAASGTAESVDDDGVVDDEVVHDRSSGIGGYGLAVWVINNHAGPLRSQRAAGPKAPA